MFLGFWWRNLREIDHLKDSGLEGSVKLRWISPGSGMWGFGLDQAG